MQAWPSSSNNSGRGRPIATIGAGTPNIQGDFWVLGLDTFTHLILPTMALILVLLASYTRFTQGVHAGNHEHGLHRHPPRDSPSGPW